MPKQIKSQKKPRRPRTAFRFTEFGTTLPLLPRLDVGNPKTWSGVVTLGSRTGRSRKLSARTRPRLRGFEIDTLSSADGTLCVSIRQSGRGRPVVFIGPGDGVTHDIPQASRPKKRRRRAA